MNKKLLFVFAHPDDESFSCGGTIPKYHHAGASISLVSATSGCKGKPGPFQLTTREEKAKHREGELQRACGILGVDKLILYRYLDGEVNQVGKKELTDRIAATILEEAPDVIVTFPPDGISGHPDHIAISFAVQRAVQQAEQDMSPDLYPDLYFIALPPQVAFRRQGVNLPSCKVEMGDYRETKARALQAHQSQVFSVNRTFPGVMEGKLDVLLPMEYYTLVRRSGQPVETPQAADERDIPAIDFI